MGRHRHGALVVLLQGVLAAVSVHKCVPLFFLSRKASLRTLQCFMLNGVMFLGSVMLANTLVGPAVSWYRELLGVDARRYSGVVWGVESGAMLMFQLFWFLPMYFISLMLSARWYNDIAQHAFKHAFDPALAVSSTSATRGDTTPPSASAPPPGVLRALFDPSHAMYFSEIIQPKQAPRKDLVTLVMEELYRLLLVIVLLLLVSLLAFIPIIGTALSFFLCCFVYSFYSFEYKWAMEGVPLTERMEMLERRWVFLFGFGAPFTLATFSFSFWVSGGIYSLLFPVNIMLAALAKPPRHRGAPRSLPLFQIPKRAALLMLKVIGPALGAGRDRRAVRRRPSAPRKPSAMRQTSSQSSHTRARRVRFNS